MTTIQERIEAGDVLVIDGGMGTELERRGVPMDSQAWAGSAMKTHPDMIRTIHRDFIEAGADIVIANTYAAAPHVLHHAGIPEDEALALNRIGCDLVREAIGEAAPKRRIWIAGSLSSFFAGLREDSYPSAEEASRSYTVQAETLAAAGCDSPDHGNDARRLGFAACHHRSRRHRPSRLGRLQRAHGRRPACRTRQPHRPAVR